MMNINPIVESKGSSNKFGTEVEIALNTDFVCPSNGVVRVGGYGGGATRLLVNAHILFTVLHGNQSFSTSCASKEVFAGDVVRIEYVKDGAKEGITNMKNFVPTN